MAGWCLGSIWTQLLLSELKAKVQDFCQHIFYREAVAFLCFLLKRAADSGS